MIFTECKAKGAFLIEIEKIEDSRGYFGRSFCVKEFKEHYLNSTIAQCNLSFAHKKGTLRGMHFQAPPREEDKLVRCTAGAIYDVLLDLRKGSTTYLLWEAFELNANNGRMLYIPKGFAHGFQTLTDNTEVFYQMSEFFSPECARGFPWNDPAFKINWPIPAPIISDKDRSFQPFKP